MVALREKREKERSGMKCNCIRRLLAIERTQKLCQREREYAVAHLVARADTLGFREER